MRVHKVKTITTAIDNQSTVNKIFNYFVGDALNWVMSFMRLTPVPICNESKKNERYEWRLLEWSYNPIWETNSFSVVHDHSATSHQLWPIPTRTKKESDWINRVSREWKRCARDPDRTMNQIMSVVGLIVLLDRRGVKHRSFSTCKNCFWAHIEESYVRMLITSASERTRCSSSLSISYLKHCGFSNLIQQVVNKQHW